MIPDLKIIAMTVLCVDVYPQKDEIYVGGNSVNFAVQCVKRGIREISVLGCVGNDGYGQAVIELLTKNHINISHVCTKEGKTASNRIFISEGGDRYFLPDSWDGGVYQNFILSENDWVYALEHDIVAIPANNPNFSTALNKLANSGKLVVDFLDSRDFDSIETTLPKIALGFISGDRQVVNRLRPLSLEMDTPIIVTLGAEGSLALHKGKEYYQEAAPVDTIVDTTGCGDSYQAAFTVSWWQEHDFMKAMKEGALAAAETLKHTGGV